VNEPALYVDTLQNSVRGAVEEQAIQQIDHNGEWLGNPKLSNCDSLFDGGTRR
jgi:hypothetical protein